MNSRVSEILLEVKFVFKQLPENISEGEKLAVSAWSRPYYIFVTLIVITFRPK